MTLTTRLSLFFLTALALVLAGFSVTLYSLAHHYLYRQVDDRLESSLDMLAAAADLEGGVIEWEPQHRHLRLVGQDSGPDRSRSGQDRNPDLPVDQENNDNPLLWLVRDDQGKRLDGSPAPFAQEFFAAVISEFVQSTRESQTIAWQGKPWRLSQRRLQAHPDPRTTQATRQQQSKEKSKITSAVQMTVAISLSPVQAILQRLAGALAATSLALWLVALLVGKLLCRRALLPVTQMALTARMMDADDLGQRLAVPHTCDELEDLGGAFNDLLSRLQESFERQRRFTGDASHQLRTPLTAILGQIEVALRRDRSPEEYERVLSSVQGQALHLRQIVEMLLFLARADAEAKLPNLQTIDLADWLDAHLLSRSTDLRAADVHLATTSDGPLWVDVLPPLLGQLVDNLLDNACKYSEPGTPISLRVGDEHGLVFLAVADAGCGISPHDLPHVFEPFFRSPGARRNGSVGIGLGLAIAKRIASAFGGHITVSSESLEGSCFTLYLPQARPNRVASEVTDGRAAQARG